jgi:hypothetical protein
MPWQAHARASYSRGGADKVRWQPTNSDSRAAVLVIAWVSRRGAGPDVVQQRPHGEGCAPSGGNAGGLHAHEQMVQCLSGARCRQRSTTRCARLVDEPLVLGIAAASNGAAAGATRCMRKDRTVRGRASRRQFYGS